MKKWKSQNRSRIDQGVFKYIQDITGTHLDIKKSLISGNQKIENLHVNGPLRPANDPKNHKIRVLTHVS